MESVTFWKNNNQGGGSQTYYYQQANRTGYDGADSLSSDAYLVIFDQNDYKGNYLKFAPGEGNDDLKKTQRGSNSDNNWKNEVNSFVFYRIKPSWWDNGGSPVVDLPVSPTGVFVAEDSDFSGDNQTLFGTIDYSDLNDVKYNTNSGRDLKDNITSLKTGSSCWVEIFDTKDFSGHSRKIYPNTVYKDLNDLDRGDSTSLTNDWSNQIESMHIYDHEPASWNMGFDNDKLASLYEVSQYLDSGFTYLTQGAKYNIYNPVLSNPDADTLQLDFALEYVITGDNTDNMALTLCFNSQGLLTTASCEITGYNGFNVNSTVITAIDVAAEAAGLIASLETEGASLLAATELVQNLDSIEKYFNTMCEEIFKILDNTDGRFYFMAVAGNLMAKSSTCLTFS